MTLDTIYRMALKEHDMETVGALVESHARRGGFSYGPVYHGSVSEGGFTVFDEKHGSGTAPHLRGFFFSGSKTVAEAYALGSGNVRAFYLKMKNPLRVDTRETKLTLFELQQEAGKHFAGLPSFFQGQPQNADGLIVLGVERGGDPLTRAEYTVLSPTQIKSAAPVVYDGQGLVIPLDKRFADTPDIRGDVDCNTNCLSGRSTGVIKMKDRGLSK